MPDLSFSFIYTSYYKKAFSFAKSYVHDEAVAEDIASEALIALWEKTKVESAEQVAPLLLTILKNKTFFCACKYYSDRPLAVQWKARDSIVGA